MSGYMVKLSGGAGVGPGAKRLLAENILEIRVYIGATSSAFTLQLSIPAHKFNAILFRMNRSPS